MHKREKETNQENISKTQCKTKTKNNKLQQNGQKTKRKMTKQKTKM